MKNIFVCGFIVLLLIPKISFAQAVGETVPSQFTNLSGVACNELDNTSVAFFQWQASEREDFGKANPNSMTAHDKYFKMKLAIDMAARTGQSTAGLPAPTPDDPLFMSFESKQLNDKLAFLSKLQQAKQSCPTTGTSPVVSAPVVTPPVTTPDVTTNSATP
jgi:hypothetical protein